jgi:hypothetical protein
MIKLVNLLKEIKVLGDLTPKVFIGVTPEGEFTELYKLEPFPAIPHTEDPTKNSPGFKKALTLVLNEAYGDSVLQGSLEEFTGSGIIIIFSGNFSSPLSKVYVYPDNGGEVAIVDSLGRFGPGYQTEQQWGWDVAEWKEIKSTPTIREITVQKPSNKITAYFERDSFDPTKYSPYGSINPKTDPIIGEFVKEYQSKYPLDKGIQKVMAVIPRTVAIKAGLGVRIDDWVFGWGSRHDTRDDLIEFLKKRGIQAFGGMYDSDLVVWIPQENTNIIRQD